MKTDSDLFFQFFSAKKEPKHQNNYYFVYVLQALNESNIKKYKKSRILKNIFRLQPPKKILYSLVLHFPLMKI